MPLQVKGVVSMPASLRPAERLKTLIRPICLLSFWCFFFLLLLPLTAETPGGSNSPQAALKILSLEELSQIEVTTPSKEPVKAFRTPASVFVITGEDIGRSGATNIPAALRTAPGLEVARIDGNKWSVGIRGFGSRLTRSVLVVMDGRTVFTPLFNGTYWEVHDTLMADIDRIVVIRGSGGTIWGPNAINGVINVITKASKDTQGLLISTGGGNEEQGFVNSDSGVQCHGHSSRAAGSVYDWLAPATRLSESDCKRVKVSIRSSANGSHFGNSPVQSLAYFSGGQWHRY
jgi:outer membrane receptor protein involved in Fe transport